MWWWFCFQLDVTLNYVHCVVKCIKKVKFHFWQHQATYRWENSNFPSHRKLCVCIICSSYSIDNLFVFHAFCCYCWRSCLLHVARVRMGYHLCYTVHWLHCRRRCSRCLCCYCRQLSQTRTHKHTCTLTHTQTCMHWAT